MVQRRTLVLFVVMCLGHVLLISAQVQSRSGLPVIEAVAFDAFARVQAITTGLTDWVRGSSVNYFALRGAARENEHLHRRVLDLEGQLQQHQAMVAETRALEEMLGLKTQSPAPMLAARVIAGSPAPGSWRITIDRGSADGVQVDMAVVGAAGVVGRVIGPIASHAAVVQLLIDRSAAVGVTFEQSGVAGIVTGGGSDPPLRAEYVPASATVQEGERVTTTGQDGVFPAGYLVGTVARVRASGADRDIAIRPAVDFSHLDLVLVVLKPPAPKGGGAE